MLVPTRQVPSRRQDMYAEHVQQPAADSRPKPGGNCYSDGSARALSIHPGDVPCFLLTCGSLSFTTKVGARRASGAVYVHCPAHFEVAPFGLPYHFAHAAGQEMVAKGASSRLSSPAKQEAPLAEDVSSDHGEPAFAPGGILNQSPGHWMSNSGERAARQVSLCWFIRIFNPVAPFCVSACSRKRSRLTCSWYRLCALFS